MSNPIDAFISNFVNDLVEENVAIFAGAGLSRGAGYIDWPELLTDIAEDLGLQIDKEYDLISLAQYHINSKGRHKLNKKIIAEFVDENELTENHRILARLNIATYWTTNYDTLLETALKNAGKRADVKYAIDQLFTTRPKRDAVVYKMHGDVSHPEKAILAKEDYEKYYVTHEPFISALTGDLISKTFLFIGFSFADPNLDYVLSRLKAKQLDHRPHYCFIKSLKLGDRGNDTQADLDYNTTKQNLRIQELRRYGIQALLVEEYCEITEILKEIETRTRKRTIFISGSAEEYGSWGRADAQAFIHSLSKQIVASGFRVITGFGWGVGSAVINGALDAIFERPDKRSEDQLVMKPFPQFKTGEKELPTLWEEYRQRMLSQAGIALFLFGNKLDGNSNIALANGVRREFEIAAEYGILPIPIPATGYMAEEIYQEVSKDLEKYYARDKDFIPLLQELGTYDSTSSKDITNKVIEIIKGVNR